MKLLFVLGLRLFMSLSFPHLVWLFSPWYLKLEVAALVPHVRDPWKLALIDYSLGWVLILISRLTNTVQVSYTPIAPFLPPPISWIVDFTLMVCLWWVSLWLIDRARCRWWLPTLLITLIVFLSLILQYVPVLYKPAPFMFRILYIALFFMVLSWKSGFGKGHELGE